MQDRQAAGVQGDRLVARVGRRRFDQPHRSAILHVSHDRPPVPRQLHPDLMCPPRQQFDLDERPPPPLDLLGEAADYRYERFAEYLAALDRTPAAINAACLVGHSTLRVGTMSALDRPADQAELARMGERLNEALDAGAIGMSSGLAYAPAAGAPRSGARSCSVTTAPTFVTTTSRSATSSTS